MAVGVPPLDTRDRARLKCTWGTSEPDVPLSAVIIQTKYLKADLGRYLSDQSIGFSDSIRGPLWYLPRSSWLYRTSTERC